jgi:hypothetical protein
MLAVGLSDGNVAVYNLQKNSSKPQYISTARNGKHQDIVWQVRPRGRIFKKIFFEIYIFHSNTHNYNENYKEQHCNVYSPIKSYTLARFEPAIFCSGDGGLSSINGQSADQK